MFSNNRFGRYVIAKFFDEETAYLLNYITLSISDKDIRQELVKHRGMQYRRIAVPISIALVLFDLKNLYSVYFQNEGHPIWVIVGCFDMVLLAFYWILRWLKKEEFYTFAIPYFIYNSICVVCVYNGWLPQSWQGYSKSYQQNTILLSFVVANAIPLIDFKWTLFVMFPVFMATLNT